MSAQGAVLSTHAMFVPSTRRRFCDDVEAHYGLVHMYTQRGKHEALARVDALPRVRHLKADALARQRLLLAEHEDTTPLTQTMHRAANSHG